MSITLQLAPGASLQPIRGVVAEFGATIVPMHPGIDDDYLRTFYDVVAPRGVSVTRLVAELLRRPGVTAAYVKPRGEAP
jgi:hypothetical protein